ncbi:MAG: hypothetical protein H6631_14340 [Anaerolineaceae bacterium]|nr:hypothetical protein [Anaerolineaceae bacterium]
MLCHTDGQVKVNFDAPSWLYSREATDDPLANVFAWPNTSGRVIEPLMGWSNAPGSLIEQADRMVEQVRRSDRAVNRMVERVGIYDRAS